MKNIPKILFILKNPYFKKIIFFNKKEVYFTLLLSLISTIIYVCFPLITQIYLKYLYIQPNINLLINVKVLFILLFFFKLLIDLKVEKNKIKYFEKLEKTIKELMIEKYNSNLSELAFKKSDLFRKHLYLYIKLVKTVYYNLLDLTRIVIAGIIIFFFDINLFMYFLYAVPIFIIFYLFSKRIELTSERKHYNIESDFGIMIKKLIDKEVSENESKNLIITNLEKTMQLRIDDKNRFRILNTSMDSFISFFRIIYMCYFGVYIIISGLQISGLIVGLLFITILMRPIIRLISYGPFYEIAMKSFFKINSLYKTKLKNEDK